MFPFFFPSPIHFDFQGKDIFAPFSGVKVKPYGFAGKIAPHEGVTIFPQNLDTGGASMTLPYKIGNERFSEIREYSYKNRIKWIQKIITTERSDGN